MVEIDNIFGTTVPATTGKTALLHRTAIPMLYEVIAAEKNMLKDLAYSLVVLAYIVRATLAG